MLYIKSFYRLRVKIIKKYLITTVLSMGVVGLCYSQPQAGVASAHPKATKAGASILKVGGNAFDAAIAVASTLSVVEPFGSGIGGGGFFLLYVAKADKYVFIDAREMAPALSNGQMFDDVNGNYSRTKALDSPLSAAIPGLPAALDYIAKSYGSLNLNVTMRDSIKIAREGFRVTQRYRKMASYRLKCLKSNREASSIFLKKSKVPPLNYVIKQPDLAKTLSSISRDSSLFYTGKIAEEMVKSVKRNSGIWNLDDLKNYVVKERNPIIEDIGGLRLVSAPPPSSGGIVLAQALKILETYELSNYKKSDRVHLIVEAMKKGYKDRAIHLGDPDFNNIDQKKLLSLEHIDALRREISLNVASESENFWEQDGAKGDQTTHFSIIDDKGNIASVTLSINYPFGSCFVAGSTGVLLNNEMDDFSVDARTPNAYGLIGLKPNSIEPRKRPLSSMTPTILDGEKSKAVLGTPGGSRIISMVLISTLDYRKGFKPDSWVSVPRYHHQFLPNKIQFEKGAFSSELKKKLVKKGHELKELNRLYGNMQAILLEKKSGKIWVASDPRGEGSAMTIK